MPERLPLSEVGREVDAPLERLLVHGGQGPLAPVCGTDRGEERLLREELGDPCSAPSATTS